MQVGPRRVCLTGAGNSRGLQGQPCLPLPTRAPELPRPAAFMPLLKHLALQVAFQAHRAGCPQAGVTNSFPVIPTPTGPRATPGCHLLLGF